MNIIKFIKPFHVTVFNKYKVLKLERKGMNTISVTKPLNVPLTFK
ncbi:hypothetical protein LEMLEM_LOCUS15576 [Lemmus lemmus]